MLHPVTLNLLLLSASAFTVWVIYNQYIQKKHGQSSREPQRRSTYPYHDSSLRQQPVIPSSQNNLNYPSLHSDRTSTRMTLQSFEPPTSRPGRVKLHDLQRRPEDNAFYGALGSGRVSGNEDLRATSQFQNKDIISSKTDAPFEKQFSGIWGTVNLPLFNPSAHPIVNEPQFGRAPSVNVSRHVTFDVDKPSSKISPNINSHSEDQYSNWRPSNVSSDLSGEPHKAPYSLTSQSLPETFGRGREMKIETRDQADASEIAYDKKKIYSPKESQLKLSKSFSKVDDSLKGKPTKKEEKNQKIQQKQHEIEQKAFKSLGGRGYDEDMQDENAKGAVFLSDLSEDERDVNEKRSSRRDRSLPVGQQPHKLVKISNEINGSVPATFNAEIQNSQKLFDSDEDEQEELPPTKPLPQKRFRIGEFPAQFKSKYHHKLEQSRQFTDTKLKSPQRGPETQPPLIPKSDSKEPQKIQLFSPPPSDKKSDLLSSPLKGNLDSEKMKPEQQQKPFSNLIPQQLSAEKETKKALSPEKPKPSLTIIPEEKLDQEVSSPTFGGAPEPKRQFPQQSLPEAKKVEDTKPLEQKPLGLSAPIVKESSGSGLFGSGGGLFSNVAQPTTAKSDLFQKTSSEPVKKQEEKVTLGLGLKEQATQEPKDKPATTTTGNALFMGNGTSLGQKASSEPAGLGLFSNNKTPSSGLGLFGAIQGKTADSDSNPLIPKADTTTKPSLLSAQKDGETKPAPQTSGSLFGGLASAPSSSGFFSNLQQVEPSNASAKEEPKGGSLLGGLFSKDSTQKATNPLFSGGLAPSMSGSLFSNVQKDKS